MKGLKKFLTFAAVTGGIAVIATALYKKYKSTTEIDEFDDFDEDDFDDDFDDLDLENRGYTSIPVEAPATDVVEEAVLEEVE